MWFIPGSTNTDATTLTVTPSGGAALTAKNVFAGGSACVGGELVAGVPVCVLYDGTQFNILNPSVTRGTTASTFTFDGSGGTTGSVTMTYQKVGQFVRLSIPAVLGTTGTGSTLMLSNTALPASVRPAAIQNSVTVPIQNNGASVGLPGAAQMLTNGTIKVFRDNAGSTFTNSTSCGVSGAFSFEYFTG